MRRNRATTDALATTDATQRAVALPRHLQAPSLGRRIASAVVACGAAISIDVLFVPMRQGFPVTLLLSFVALAMAFRRRARREANVTRVRPAIKLFADGELERARAELDAIWAMPFGTEIDGEVRLYRAVVELELGDPALALAMLDTVDESIWLDGPHGRESMRALVFANKARAHAQLCEHELATRALAEAHAGLPEEQRGLVTPSEAEVLARQGRFAEALMCLETNRAVHERLMPRRRGFMRVLQGYCERALAQDYRGEAPAPHVVDALHEPAIRATAERAARNWPELQVFLDAQRV